MRMTPKHIAAAWEALRQMPVIEIGVRHLMAEALRDLEEARAEIERLRKELLLADATIDEMRPMRPVVEAAVAIVLSWRERGLYSGGEFCGAVDAYLKRKEQR